MNNLLLIFFLPFVNYIEGEWRTTSVNDKAVFVLYEDHVLKLNIEDISKENLAEYTFSEGRIKCKCLWPPIRAKRGYYETISVVTAFYPTGTNDE